MQLTDYLVDWAEQVRALAAEQTDKRVQKKLAALAEECGRISLLMDSETDVKRLH